MKDNKLQRSRHNNNSNKRQMDLFFLCWSFDSRWLFKVKNPCHELIYTIPLAINVVSLVWTYIENVVHTDDHLPFFIQVVVLLSLLSISNLYLMCIIRMNSAEKISSVKENYVAIQEFYHSYETKKVIWSFIGLIFTILAVTQTIMQSLYINRNKKVYQCEANTFRYYLDIAAYSYIGLNILVFLLVKVVYLLSAWVCCPGVYLKIKKIID